MEQGASNGAPKALTPNTQLRSLKTEAERVGVHPRTLRRWIADGKLKSYGFGRTLRIDPQELNALFASTKIWGA